MTPNIINFDYRGLYVLRFGTSPLGTIGSFFLNGSHVCYSLERPWLDNLPFNSCFPAGVYNLGVPYSYKGGIRIDISGIPERDHCQIHTANFITELEGCISPGTTFGVINNKFAILSPVTAMHTLANFIQANSIGKITILWLDDPSK